MSTVEKLDNSMVSFEFSVSAEEFDKAVNKAYKKNVGRINVQGFRKGKAPRAIIERYYGKEIFYEDAVNIVLPDAYDKAIEENNIEAVAQPEIDVKEISAESGVVFTAKVTVKPEFELGTYKGVEVSKVTHRTTEKEINAEIEKVRERNSRLVSVEDRAAELNDTVNIDFEGFADGKAFEGGKGEGFDLTLGSGQFIPGFEEQLVGKNIGDEVDVNVTFPKEYHAEDLKGKDALFKVKINGIKVKELPELDDEFAKDVSEFDTLAELKASIKEKLEKNNEQRAKYETEEAAIKAVCADAKLDIPTGMIDLEVENMLKDFEQRLSYQGLKMEQYLNMIGKTEEEMRKEYEPQATEAIKSRLVLEAIINAEKIEASEEEIKAKMEEMAKNYGKKVEELSENENLKKYLDEGIRSEKALAFIVENAKFGVAKKETKKATKKSDK